MHNTDIDKLKIFHTNIRSIVKNFAKLEAYLGGLNFKYNIIVLTETNLNSMNEDMYELDGYRCLYMTRPTKGGGICIYIDNSFSIQECEEFSDIFETHEALFVKISSSCSFTFVIGCFYRPPSCSIVEFNEYLNNILLGNRLVYQHKCIFIGDFNIDLLKMDRLFAISNFIDIMKEEGFDQLITDPTRISDQTGLPNSLLDQIWINFSGKDVARVIDFPFSDHLPIEIIIDIKLPNEVVTVSFRDLSERNFERFNANKQRIFDEYIIETNDSNNEIIKFVNWLNEIVDIYFPMRFKVISRKRLNSPWLSKQIMKFIDKKHKLFIALKRQLISYNYFKAYSNVLRIMINRAKTLYFRHKFVTCNNDSKKIWKVMNNILGRNKKGQSSFNEVKLSDDTITSDPRVIANEFNKYFNSVPKETQANLKKSLFDYLYLIKENNNTLSLDRTCSAEIIKIITALKNKGNSSKIPLKFLKYIAGEISTIIAKLFNLTIEDRNYPKIFKEAKIIPLFKSGKKNSILNYRPISLLPIFNKIFEKLLYARFDAFIKANNIISEDQFGFTFGKDTQRATLRLVSRIIPTMGTSDRACCVYLDFKKAFDTISHHILFKKLDRYGIRGAALELIKSYLGNRHHYVSINGNDSSKLICNVGVPQGSVLGPLLFIIYTTDLCNLLADTKPIMFADDTAVIKIDRDPVMLEFAMNYSLYKIYDWCNFNRLALNCIKSKWMYFSFRRDYIPVLRMNGELIERVSEFKYLGFNLDDKLSHSYHLRYLTGKFRKLSYISRSVKKYFNNKTAKTFYYSMVHSIVNYGLLVWGGTLVEGSSAKKLCRKFDKIIYNLFSLPNDAFGRISEIFKREGLLKLQDIYKVKSCVTIYRILYENYAPFIFDDLLPLVRVHSYNTRNRDNLLLPFPQVRSVKLNFLYQGIKSWNDLDACLDDFDSSFSLKRKLTESILNSY
jgi:hypothetical protein